MAITGDEAFDERTIVGVIADLLGDDIGSALKSGFFILNAFLRINESREICIKISFFSAFKNGLGKRLKAAFFRDDRAGLFLLLIRTVKVLDFGEGLRVFDFLF